MMPFTRAGRKTYDSARPRTCPPRQRMHGRPVNESLLLVEDDASIGEIASIGLKASGYRVATAVDGREAQTRLRAESLDPMILNVMLPPLDGINVHPDVRHVIQV